MFWMKDFVKEWFDRKRKMEEENLRRAILAEKRDQMWDAYFVDLGKRMRRDFN